MLTGMRRKRRMLKLCKNAAKNCLTPCTSRLLKQPRGALGPAKNLQEGILECLNSANFNSVTRTNPQNSLFYTVTSPALQTWPQHFSVWSVSDGKFSTDGPDTQSHSAHCRRTLQIWARCCEWCKKKKRWVGGHIGLGKFCNRSFLHGSKKKQATSLLKLNLVMT